MDKPLLEQALEYAEHGFYVFPCRWKYDGTRINPKSGKVEEMRAKMPLTKRGFKDASIDKSQIEYWWNRQPNAAIGCDLGRSKLFVVDVDNHKEGVNGMDAWHKVNVSDEGCAHVFTPNKGLHIYFSDPKGLGKTKANDSIGLDFRGVGGYSILPNSKIMLDDGTVRKYICVDNLFATLREVTEDAIEKFGLSRKGHISRGGNFVSNLTLDEEMKKIKYVLDNLPDVYLEDYSKWVEIGMSLRKFKEAGYRIWAEWTMERYFSRKPNSKRVPNMEGKWNSFVDVENPITLATLYGTAKKEGILWKKEKV